MRPAPPDHESRPRWQDRYGEERHDRLPLGAGHSEYRPFAAVFRLIRYGGTRHGRTARTADRAVPIELRRCLAGLHAILETPVQRAVSRAVRDGMDVAIGRPTVIHDTSWWAESQLAGATGARHPFGFASVPLYYTGMDTVRKEAARRRRAGLARRGLRESAGQRKAGRREATVSPTCAVSGACRAWTKPPCVSYHGSEAVDEHRQLAASNVSTQDWAVATQPGWVCWMTRKPEKTGMVSGRPVCSPPGRVALSLVRSTRRRGRQEGEMGRPCPKARPYLRTRADSISVPGQRPPSQAGVRRGASTAHLAGCMVGCRHRRGLAGGARPNVWHAPPVGSPSPLSAYQHLERSRQVSQLATGRDYSLQWQHQSPTCGIPYPYSRSRDLASVRR